MPRLGDEVDVSKAIKGAPPVVLADCRIESGLEEPQRNGR